MEQGTVINGTAEIREKPDSNSPVSDEVLHGMTVYVGGGEENGFYCAETFYGYSGYIRKEHISFEPFEPDRMLTARFADILTEPGIKSNIVMTLPKGSFLKYISESKNNFTKVMAANGVAGFLINGSTDAMPDFGGVTDESVFRGNVVKAALGYLGTPYRWGGRSTLGIDCSGLCHMAYMRNGVIICRDAVITDGFPVRRIKKSPGRGDLVFFAGHVAMYIGGGKIIHSSLANNGVYINSLNPGDAGYKRELAESILFFGSIF